MQSSTLTGSQYQGSVCKEHWKQQIALTALLSAGDATCMSARQSYLANIGDIRALAYEGCSNEVNIIWKTPLDQVLLVFFCQCGQVNNDAGQVDILPFSAASGLLLATGQSSAIFYASNSYAPAQWKFSCLMPSCLMTAKEQHLTCQC